ncbi:MAG: MATE family efflux transporter [Acidobacteria bacterium]|nr:MATE family efflux transporter [Acidobacteriota bacterium]
MQDLTTGSLTRHLLKTTSFMLVTMVFQTLYFLVDLYWVGRLGKEAVAAVGIAGNLMFISLAISQMLGVGTTTLVSHAVGRQDRPRALEIFNQSLVLSAVIGVLFFVLAMTLRPHYATVLSADTATAARASEYMLWFIPALSLQYVIVAMTGALRATGNFKPGMVVQVWTVILNMVLTPILIFGWMTGRPLGVAGAAIATLVAVIVSGVWLVFYFLPTTSYLKFKRDRWRPQPHIWTEMVKVGLPAGGEFALMAINLFVVYIVARPFGAAAQAGFGIGLRIVQAGFMPIVALGAAVAPVAGQNFGARKADRVRQTFTSGAFMAAIGMMMFQAICALAPARLVGFFSNDPRVIAEGAEYLRIVSWNFAPNGVILVASSMFQAMGNTMPSLLSSSVRLALFAVPAVMLSGMTGFELRWIWYLAVLAMIVQFAASLLFLRREFRVRLAFETVTAGA